MRSGRLLPVLAALLCAGSAARADSDEYSALAFVESTVIGLNQESTITLRSPVVGSAVLGVVGLEPAGIDLGGSLPVLRVGPPYFTFGGTVSSEGTFEMTFRIGPSFPQGVPLYVQGLLVMPSGLVKGSNRLQLFPDHTTTTWTDGTAALPLRTSLFGGGDVDWEDVDKNGFPDALIANAGDGALPSLLMNGPLGMTDEAASRLPSVAQAPAVCVELADVDEDGYADVFLGMGPDVGPAPNLLLLNDGTANFAADDRFPPGGGLAVDGEFGDMDGDEDLDLFVVSGTDPNHPGDPPDPTTFYRQDRSGAFVPDAAFWAIPTNEPLVVDGDVSLGDVDRDGDLDVFVANSGPVSGGGQNRIYFNDGTGTFTDHTAYSLPAIEDKSFEADFIDINQDGLLDIFVANSLFSTTGINMLVNVGALMPGDPVVFFDGEGVFLKDFPPSTDIRLACDVADVEGDGDLDIGVAVHHLFGTSGAEGEAFLLLNQGGVQGGITGQYSIDGTFHQFGAIFIAGDMSFSDVDNDGDVDCYVTSNGQLSGPAPPQDILLLNEL